MLIDELLRLDQATGRAVQHRDDRHRRAVPRDARHWRKFEERYGVQIEVEDAKSPDTPWSGPEHCCSVPKVQALERSLEDAGAWVTGSAASKARRGRTPS